jgi:hypothetical protein
MNNKNNDSKRWNSQEKFWVSLPKIVYGLMKEIQRANRLKALELKFKFDENFEATVEDVDAIMDSDPAGKYGKKQQPEEPSDTGSAESEG